MLARTLRLEGRPSGTWRAAGNVNTGDSEEDKFAARARRGSHAALAGETPAQQPAACRATFAAGIPLDARESQSASGCETCCRLLGTCRAGGCTEERSGLLSRRDRGVG